MREGQGRGRDPSGLSSTLGPELPMGSDTSHILSLRPWPALFGWQAHHGKGRLLLVVMSNPVGPEHTVTKIIIS